MRRYYLFFVLLLALLGAALAVGCGPSFQATYECDVHFEHCYALDETVASAPMKEQCWHDWLAGYTFGQPRNRVDFAANRVKTLSAPRAVDPPTDGSATPRAASPLPTTAFVTPPPVASVEASASAPSAPSPRPIASDVPGAVCVHGCQQRWSSCHDTCQDGTCTRCDRVYRSCMPGCFREDGGGSRARAVQ